MKLSFDTIKSITVGAIRVWEEDGSIRFSKCTKKQADAWLKLGDFLSMCATATTGIRLDFYTNSSSLSFSVTSGIKFEIYVNNLMQYNIKKEDIQDGSFSAKLEGEEGEEKRVTLIFPSHDFPVFLSSLELDDGATVRRADFDCKILFMGDSITQGCASGYDSLSYAYRVSRFFNAESIIHGVGGGFYHETIFDEELPFDPDIVILAYGTNDWGRYHSLEELQEQAGKFLGAMAKKYSDKKIFAISPIWRADTENNVKATGTFKEVCDVIKKQITDAGITLIDGYTLIPHHTDFFADAFLHPNALGFGIYAENLIKELQKHL